MKTITFQENRILYFQDMNYFRGIPSGVEFTIETIDEKSARLSAPNYGGKPYGNGKIFIPRSQRMAKVYEYLWEQDHPNELY